MRSLTLTRAQAASICGSEDSKAGALAVDPESGVLYVTVESKTDMGVEIQVVALTPGPDGGYMREIIATFSSPVLAPFALPEYKSEVLDIHYFPDDRSLAILLAGGDIGTLSLEGVESGSAQVEVVGSVDSGIKAACWSPDDEQLVLVTGEDTLVCMTRNFDLVHEEPLRQEDFGEDKFINVGWGSKSTQFHGSLGKAAAKQPVASTSSATAISQSHPTDDALPVITFRGDCAYFAISSLDPYSASPNPARRQIRIYSRDASAGFTPKLSSTTEEMPGLEGAISWRPSGNLLSGLARYGYDGGGAGKEGKWDVAMIERNGLRHGGFALREEMGTWEGGRVRGLKWNVDSEVLAIWIERPGGDVVQLWTMKNYHYYLKQEIYSNEGGRKRFNGIVWHPEEPFTIYIIGQTSIQARTYVWDTYSSRQAMPLDTATVAVVDGSRLLLTPFRTQNTPPPMSSYQIQLPLQPVHVALSHNSDSLATLLHDGSVQVWDLNTRLPGPKGSRLRGGGKAAEPVLRWEGRIEAEVGILKQICMDDEGRVAVLSTAQHGSGGVLIRLEEGKQVAKFDMDQEAERLVWDSTIKWGVLDREGNLLQLPNLEPVATLCPQPQSIAISHEASLIFALSFTGKLLAASTSTPSETITVASSVTSFVHSPDFLIYSTSAHHSHYASLPVLQRMVAGDDVAAFEQDWETRRVERGSILVTACPSEMSLVMQMPRGNLETVYPRPLVLAVVRREVLGANYRSAFMICRKHRLDLNVLHDLDPEGFMTKLPEFIKQIPEVDYLNLFISALSDDDSSKILFKDLARSDGHGFPKNKVNRICDALRTQLESGDIVKYVDTILTAHVCKQPADYESGLRLLLQLQADHPAVVEDAIKYIIFLSDVNQLYDVALGMYDFQLVLMVAQYSQKDPKEYLPFLRELRALDKYEQRFRIDDQLERRGSALRNLAEAGPSRWSDASSYMARYELFEDGFKLYAEDEEKIPVVHELYGDYLYDRREFTDAALSYSLAKQPKKALKAYEKAHAWRELFALAKEQEVSSDALYEMCERVSDHLASRGRPIEASRILVEYGKDVDKAVDILCRGAEFSEALRLVSVHDRSDLIESVVHPGLEEAQESLTEIFEEMDGQLDKEIKRLGELRRIRRGDPDTFYLVDNEPDLEGVDVATNATTAVTNFTRYTVAPTIFSQTTKMTGQTNKTRHKPSKKRAAGRKGTVDEYDYLLMSIGRLVTRVEEKSGEAIPLLRHLLLATPEHRDMAKELQKVIIGFREKLDEALMDAWKDRKEILEEAVESGGLVFGGDVRRFEEVKGAVKPEVKVWKGLGVLAK